MKNFWTVFLKQIFNHCIGNLFQILSSFTDKYHCPVTFKVFNSNTHIVAVKTTGNVFSFEVCLSYLPSMDKFKWFVSLLLNPSQVENLVKILYDHERSWMILSRSLSWKDLAKILASWDHWKILLRSYHVR